MQKHLILALLSFITFAGINSYASQTVNTASNPAQDHATIQRRRIVLTRSPALVGDSPYKRHAVVVYPVVSGLSPAVLRRVHSILDFKNIFDYSLKEYREDTWLSEFSYVLNYNKNYLLDITFTQSGSAAYPDEQSKHFLINLKNGNIVKAADVFQPDKISQVVALVDRELQREIEKLKLENKEPDEQETVDGAYDNLKFELKDVDDFSVGPKGITFLYDAGFPHVIRALEPAGRYFFSYESLRNVIKRDGPLGQFVQ
jgi:hypothetical protein